MSAMYDDTSFEQQPPKPGPDPQVHNSGSEEPLFSPAPEVNFRLPVIDLGKLVDRGNSSTVITTPVNRESRLRYAMHTIVDVGRAATTPVLVETDENGDVADLQPVVNPYAGLDRIERRKAVHDRDKYFRDGFVSNGQKYQRGPLLDIDEVHRLSVGVLEESNHPALAFLDALDLRHEVPARIRQELSHDVVTTTVGWEFQRKLHEKRITIVRAWLKSGVGLSTIGL